MFPPEEKTKAIAYMKRKFAAQLIHESKCLLFETPDGWLFRVYSDGVILQEPTEWKICAKNWIHESDQPNVNRTRDPKDAQGDEFDQT